MTKRAVIFDFGGVLMKTVDYSPRHQWDDRLSLPQGSVEKAVHNSDSWTQAQIGKIPLAVYWENVSQRLQLSIQQVNQLARDFYSGDQLDADLVQYIHQLRESGYATGLLSNDSVELRPKLKSLDIEKLFDPLIISAEIGVTKPDARAYQAVLEKLNCSADMTIFIDDRRENVDGATALGMYPVFYHTGMDLRATLVPILDA
jgi:epoxide hydrolase-like predicted phosphatase